MKKLESTMCVYMRINKRVNRLPANWNVRFDIHVYSYINHSRWHDERETESFEIIRASNDGDLVSVTFWKNTIFLQFKHQYLTLLIIEHTMLMSECTEGTITLWKVDYIQLMMGRLLWSAGRATLLGSTFISH